MAKLSTWWRTARLALTALVACLFAFGHAIEAVACDDAASKPTAVSDASAAVIADLGESHGAPNADCALHCLGGHCHHVAPSVDDGRLALEALTPSSVRHSMLHISMPASAPDSGLKRPPRA